MAKEYICPVCDKKMIRFSVRAAVLTAAETTRTTFRSL